MPQDDLSTIRISILSFGFKYGVPAEADLMFDVRFLPNPHFTPHLKDKNGLDSDVKDFVFKGDVARDFISRVKSLLEYLLPHYVREGKAYLTVAVGCTGGRHRSVAVAENLAASLKNGQGNVNISIRHRDIARI